MALKTFVRRVLLRAAAGRVMAAVPSPNPPQRVAVLRPDHLGDLLLTTPALAHLRAVWPGAHISLLVGPWNADLAAHLPMIDEVLTLDFPFFDRRPKGSLLHPYAALPVLARTVAAGGYDTALVMRHDFWWGAALAAKAGIPRRAGMPEPLVAEWLTEALPQPLPMHEAARCLALAEAVTGVPATPRPAMQFHVAAEERAWADRWLAERAVTGRVLVVHPGAGAAVKLWPAERWGDALRALRGAVEAVVVTGTPGEAALVAAVADACPLPVHPLVGAAIGQTAAVVQRAAVVAGPDSGVLHLAEAVGTPTVRLFGPASDARFGPWQPERGHLVVRSEVACVACERLDYTAAELPHHPCVRAIEPERVVRAVRSALAVSEVVR